MRAKVSYTMDVEDVPDLISDIILECKNSLACTGKTLNHSVHDLEKTIMKISEARDAIGMIDQKLEDVVNIVFGLMSMNNTESPPVQQQGTPDE